MKGIYKLLSVFARLRRATALLAEIYLWTDYKETAWAKRVREFLDEEIGDRITINLSKKG